MSNTLKNAVYYSDERVSINELNFTNYISTDNLLQNKLGKVDAEKLPLQGGNVTKFSKGDILISNIRPYLKKIWLAKYNGGSSSDVLSFKVQPNYDATFVYYTLFRDDFFEYAMKGSKGTKMPRGDKRQILNFPIPKFDIKDQRKIAKVLSDLDAKIELNNKINSELEAMAKKLYDYWFVQFDFPDVNGRPYKASGGKMVWNEDLKREIPEGWESAELSDIANITMGQSPPGDSYNEEKNGTVFYQGSTDFGNRFPTVRKFTTSPTRFATQGDILLSVRAPVGTLNIAKEDCCIGRGLAALNSKNNCMGYLFGVMTDLKQIFDRRNVAGTTFGSITKDDLFSLKAIKPSEILLRAFDAIVKPCFDKQNKLEYENIELSSLRDWLLPMLMNGQVTVTDNVEDYEKDEVLALVAAPVASIKQEKKKVTKVISIKPTNVEIYKRTLLAAEIVYQLKDTYTLGHLKLQKMLYLCQEIGGMNLPMNFLKQAMGPYDNQLARSLDKQFVVKKWFEYQKDSPLKYKPLENCGKHKADFQKYFGSEVEQINYLINKFKKFTSNQIEAVATLYACWKEAVENKEMINDKLIITKFYQWSKEKEKFKEENLEKALDWMRKNGVEPKKIK